MASHVSFAVLIVLLSGAQDEDPMARLAPGEGRETTYYMCGACHSVDLVAQQRLSRDRWDDLLDWMTAEQNMPPLDPEVRTEILDYLSERYGPEPATRRSRRR